MRIHLMALRLAAACALLATGAATAHDNGATASDPMAEVHVVA